MKKTKLKRLIAIQEKLYNRNSDKFKTTKNRIHKINSEIFVAQYDELFFVKVENALNNGWAGSLQETNNFTDLLLEARNGDATASEMLKNVFKPNPAFKKETARFANV